MTVEACKLVVLPRGGTGICSGCSEPRYDYRVRQTETGAVVAYLCRACAMHLAVAILEQEVG